MSVIRLASDDPVAEARALEAGQIARSVQRFLDERDAPPDLFMVVKHLLMALQMNGGLSRPQYAVLVKELEEAQCSPVEASAVMRVVVPNLMKGGRLVG